MNSIIAAGFVEITDTPQAFLTAVVSLFAYLFFVFLATCQLMGRWNENKKETIIVLALTLLAPFFIREAAVIVMSPYWRDWHFIWLYLITSILVAGSYHLVIAAWRFNLKWIETRPSVSHCKS